MSIIVKIPTPNTLSCSQLNSPYVGLTFTQRQQIQVLNPIKSGQLVSYRTGDDGDLEYGLGVSFTALTCNNPFGNTNRFTDTSGGQTYSDNLVVDWLTGLMWHRIPISGVWNGAIDNSLAATTGGYTDWFLPNIKQLMTLSNFGVTGHLNYFPFNININSVATRLWSSTTCSPVVTNAAQCLIEVNNNIIGSTKTTLSQYIYCRFFTLSELGF